MVCKRISNCRARLFAHWIYRVKANRLVCLLLHQLTRSIKNCSLWAKSHRGDCLFGRFFRVFMGEPVCVVSGMFFARLFVVTGCSGVITQHQEKECGMADCYCKYCGKSFSSVRSLTSDTCSRHPDGVYKGKHVLYEGDEKSEYLCKYCGRKFSSLRSLTSETCSRHPDGNGKGKHSPAL